MTTLSWQEIAILLILLCAVISNIAAHKRIDDLEHQIERLRKTTLRGFELAGGLGADDAEDDDNWT